MSKISELEQERNQLQVIVNDMTAQVNALREQRHDWQANLIAAGLIDYQKSLQNKNLEIDRAKAEANPAAYVPNGFQTSEEAFSGFFTELHRQFNAEIEAQEEVRRNDPENIRRSQDLLRQMVTLSNPLADKTTIERMLQGEDDNGLSVFSPHNPRNQN